MPYSFNTPNGTPFEFEINHTEKEIVITSGKGNQHAYALSSLHDLQQWLKEDMKGEWVVLGTQGEEKAAHEGTVEEWARSENNPIGDYYGLTKGRRGRFATYVPSILEFLGFVEVEHKAKGNRVRSLK